MYHETLFSISNPTPPAPGNTPLSNANAPQRTSTHATTDPPVGSLSTKTHTVPPLMLPVIFPVHQPRTLRFAPPPVLPGICPAHQIQALCIAPPPRFEDYPRPFKYEQSAVRLYSQQSDGGSSLPSSSGLPNLRPMPPSQPRPPSV